MKNSNETIGNRTRYLRTIAHVCGMDVKQGETSGTGGEKAYFTKNRRLY